MDFFSSEVFVDKIKEKLEKMSEEQLDFISAVISEGLNANYLVNEEFTIEQMQVILDGLRAEKAFYLYPGSFVKYYSSVDQNKITAEEMRNILNKCIEMKEQQDKANRSNKLTRIRSALSALERNDYKF